MRHITLRFALIALAAIAAISIGHGTSRAGDILGYSATFASQFSGAPNVYDARFDRFTTGFGKPTGPTEPPLANIPPAPGAGQFIAGNLNLSGVGWLSTDTTFAAAMISPRDFITAAHNGETPQGFVPGVSQVTFYTGNATTTAMESVTVASIRRVQSTPGSPFGVTDILVGTLASDVPAGVTSYAIPIGTRSQFTGMAVNIYDQRHKVGTNTVTDFFDNANIGNPAGTNNSTNLVFYPFPSGGSPTGTASVVTGDSGKPTFINVGGQATLLGPHSAILTDDISGARFSADAFLPDYVVQIQMAMTANTSPYLVRTVPVPEPTLMLTAVAIGAGAWAGWRCARRARAA